MDTPAQTSPVDWEALLASWDKQQTAYVAFREDRFSLMLQALADHVGTKFTFVDLGCGPGSLTQRILDAFPLATAIAVDTDPVLLRMAHHALARFGERVKLVDVDMRSPDWTGKLPVQHIDAAVSTTALHWLMPNDLIRVYGDVVALMLEGGMVLNGDHLAYDTTERFSHHLAEADKDRAQRRLVAAPGTRDWDAWWADLAREPALRDAFAQRAERQAAAEKCYGPCHQSPLSNLALHTLALRNAGCSEVTTIWQRFDDRVLMGIKGRRLVEQRKPIVQQVSSYWNDPQRAAEYDTASQHAPGYDRAQAEVAWCSEFASVLPPAPAAVLDMGCGPGFVSLNLAAMGYQVRGIDMAENMLLQARQRASDKGLQATFELGDATAPTGKPAAYDAIISRYLFWTLPDPMRTLTTAKPLLKPGAVMAIFDGTWYSEGWKHGDYAGKPWYELWNEVYTARTRNNLPLMQDNPAPKVAALLEAAGYVNVQWRALDAVHAMNERTMGKEHGEGETYVVWGHAPS